MRSATTIAAVLVLGWSIAALAHAEQPSESSATPPAEMPPSPGQVQSSPDDTSAAQPDAAINPDTVRDATAPGPVELEPPAYKPPHIDVGLGTIVPLYLGAQAVIEGPWRLLGSFEIGWMPKPYAYGIDDLLKTFGVYPDEVSQLIREALKSSLVLRPSIGWRPFPDAGFEFTVGYTYLSLGGGLSGRQAIESATMRTFPSDTANQIPLHSTLHNIHVQLAWRFRIGDHFVARVSLAYLHTLASSTGIDVSPRTAVGKRAVDEINQRIDDYLNGYYTKYVHAPLVGLTAAYRF